MRVFNEHATDGGIIGPIRFQGDEDEDNENIKITSHFQRLSKDEYDYLMGLAELGGDNSMDLLKLLIKILYSGEPTPSEKYATQKNEDLSTLIKRKRMELGLSRNQVVNQIRQLGLTAYSSLISELEGNNPPNLKVSHLVAIADILRIDPAVLLGKIVEARR